MKFLKGYLKWIFHFAARDSTNSIFSLLEKNPEAIFLDCGCGDGKFTKCLIERIGGVKEVHGIEIVKDYYRKAEERGMIVHQDDLNNKMSLKNKSVDIIIANQLIEHLYDTDNFLSEIYRVLRPKGYAVLCTENLASWHNIFALVLGWQPFSSSCISTLRYAIGNPLSLRRDTQDYDLLVKTRQHNRVFAYRGLKEICEIHRFKVEKIVGTGYYPFPPILSRLMCKIDKHHAAFLTFKIRK